jgi:transposase
VIWLLRPRILGELDPPPFDKLQATHAIAYTDKNCPSGMGTYPERNLHEFKPWQLAFSRKIAETTRYGFALRTMISSSSV